MKALKTFVRRFKNRSGLRMLKDRSGATVIEYCMIAGIISIAIVGWATMIGNKTNASFNAVQVGFN